MLMDNLKEQIMRNPIPNQAQLLSGKVRTTKAVHQSIMILTVVAKYDLSTMTLHVGRSHASSGNEEANGPLTPTSRPLPALFWFLYQAFSLFA